MYTDCALLNYIFLRVLLSFWRIKPTSVPKWIFLLNEYIEQYTRFCWSPGGTFTVKLQWETLVVWVLLLLLLMIYFFSIRITFSSKIAYKNWNFPSKIVHSIQKHLTIHLAKVLTLYLLSLCPLNKSESKEQTRQPWIYQWEQFHRNTYILEIKDFHILKDEKGLFFSWADHCCVSSKP